MGRATAGALALALAVAVAVAIAVAAPEAARSADWTMNPTLTVGIDNDTNRLLVSPAIPSRGLSMGVDTRFERDTERWKLSLRPQGQLERYTDARLNHTDEEGIDATATWLQTERSSLTLHALLQDASTLYSELTGTGIIHLGQRRRDEDVDGTWAFQENERWTLELGGSHDSSAYHGAVASTLSNYRQTSGTAAENFTCTEQLVFSLNASAGDAHTAGAEQSTHFQSLGVGFQWHPSERLSVQGSGGTSRQTSGSFSSTTVIGALSLSYA